VRLAFLHPVQIRKIHEPNRPLIERLRRTKEKGAIIRARENCVLEREREKTDRIVREKV